jgi:hypothetical protein
MNDITPEPPAEEPTVTPTAQPVAEPPMAATPAPFATEERKRRLSTPVAGGVLAGVIGLGLGAGVVALAGGHDDHRGNDRRMSDQQVQTQNPSQNQGQIQPGQQGGMMPGGQGQPGQQGGLMPGRRGDRHAQPGQQGQQGQQGGGFFPPNGGGQPQGRSGGS